MLKPRADRPDTLVGKGDSGGGLWRGACLQPRQGWKKKEEGETDEFEEHATDLATAQTEEQHMQPGFQLGGQCQNHHFISSETGEIYYNTSYNVIKC